MFPKYLKSPLPVKTTYLNWPIYQYWLTTANLSPLSSPESQFNWTLPALRYLVQPLGYFLMRMSSRHRLGQCASPSVPTYAIKLGISRLDVFPFYGTLRWQRSRFSRISRFIEFIVGKCAAKKNQQQMHTDAVFLKCICIHKWMHGCVQHAALIIW